ncbi:hypothetical protein AKJ16_DCAP16224 [Drosera capensis]
MSMTKLVYVLVASLSETKTPAKASEEAEEEKHHLKTASWPAAAGGPFRQQHPTQTNSIFSSSSAAAADDDDGDADQRHRFLKGLTGSVILKSGALSDVILQVQELIKGVNEADIYPIKSDAAVIAAQIRRLTEEIRELSLSNPITVLNCNPTSTGSYASYLVPAAALGAMGYCYMWWKGWSLSDIMFVTKENMANAVASVSKQLESVSEALAATRRHLTKRLENLDWKVEELKECTKFIADDVDEASSTISQIEFDIGLMHQMVVGLDKANSALWHLCHVAGGIRHGLSGRISQDARSKLGSQPKISYEEHSLKGLQFIVEPNESTMLQKPLISTKNYDIDKIPMKNVSTTKTRLHRSYPVGISIAPNIIARDP